MTVSGSQMNLLGAKKNLCTLECKKKQSGLTVHAMIFLCNCHWLKEKPKVQVKRKFYTTKIYVIFNHLLHKVTDLPLPTHESTKALAEEFICFFNDEVAKIQAGLTITPSVESLENFPEPPAMCLSLLSMLWPPNWMPTWSDTIYWSLNTIPQRHQLSVFLKTFYVLLMTTTWYLYASKQNDVGKMS